MMFATVDKRLLSSFFVGSRNNDKFLVSHLLFADDTMIFCEQIVINFIIRDVYSCFEAGLGDNFGYIRASSSCWRCG
jgi:hypothetical protein